ncbi:MAG TPA: hypothetical protein VNG69_05705, partial [Casimicrobiaceae bacterium]|nr:hypothetical protein [Casimicrobiaceae bacterium]
PPTAPPVCTLSSNNSSPYAGGVVTLTANCTQSPTSHSWVGCSSSGSTCQASSANAGTAAYAVTASNGFGPGSPASTTVDWQTPPASGADFCGSYSQVVRVDLNYGSHFDTYSSGGFPANAVFSGRITVPANATSTSSGVVSVVEYIDPQAHRVMSISPSPCDFRGFSANTYPSIDATGASAPMGWSFGINPNIFYSLAGMPGGGAKLIPGQTYYVNIMNRDYSTNQGSCGGANCNVRITVTQPR